MNGETQQHLVRAGPVVGFDARWQFPAVTEQHAFRKAIELLPSVPGVMYLGFPWATYIDQANHVGSGRTSTIDRMLCAIRTLAIGQRRVATVCQHIHLLRYQHLMAEAGVTDVYWSHARPGENSLPDYPHIGIHPFPLYPVQAMEGSLADVQRDRYLFSFIGARADQWYLTDTRNLLLDLLGGHPEGFVLARDQWHYNRIVYEHQISGSAGNSAGLVDEGASNEFRRVMAESTFSLCPSGSGPNSIRLWESIGLGSIPVVLSDDYAPPGNRELWREAVVECREDATAIRALPERLADLAADSRSMRIKRRALQQIWHLYGPHCFVYDLQKAFLRWSDEALDRPTLDPEALRRAAHNAGQGRHGDDLPGPEFVVACASRGLCDPVGFFRLIESDGLVRTMLMQSLSAADRDNTDLRRLRGILRLRWEHLPQQLRELV